MIRRPPKSPIFPYTTLCRSFNEQIIFEVISHRYTTKAKNRILEIFPETTLPMEDEDRKFKYGQFGYGNMFILKDRKSTRLNSSHVNNSYAVFCLKKNNYNHL